jgi:hypothetical protein
MRERNGLHSALTSTVNFYISVAFILAFGLTATSIVLRIAELEDPITASVTAALLAAED